MAKTSKDEIKLTKNLSKSAAAFTPVGLRGVATNKADVMVGKLSDSVLKRKAGFEFLGSSDVSDTSRVPIMYVDPMFDPILLMFPKENLKELNRRLRHYYSFHPIIRNLINLHSTFPFGDMELRCPVKELEPYWKNLGDKLDITQMVVQMSRDYELLGECHKPGTQILLSDLSTKSVENIMVSDKIVTAEGYVGAVKVRTSKQVNEDLIGLSVNGTQYTWLTKDHPILKANADVIFTSGDGARILQAFSFIRADDLKVGDFITSPQASITAYGSIAIPDLPGIAAGAKIHATVGGKHLIQISDIKKEAYSGPVYSMEIDGDPTYIADGIAVHNSFHAGNWSDTELEWEGFNQYPPENIEVHSIYTGPGTAYFLKPDDELRRKLNSDKEIDRAIVDLLPEDVKISLLNGKPLHLDNNRIIHYANKSAGYMTRGESPLKSALKYLLAEDKLFMLLLVFIDRHMFPLKIWKIGSKEQKWMPSKKHFDMLKQKLIEAKGDPDYDLIYHAYLDMEYKTGSTQHEDLIKWFDWTQKRILIAMFANEAMFSEANPYAKDATSIKLIMHRYMLQRALINKLIMTKLWLPVAQKRDLEVITSADVKNNMTSYKINLPLVKKYAVPKMFWRPSNLVSGMQEKEFLYKLRDKGDLPLEPIYDLLGLDSDKIKELMKYESSTEFDPLWRKAKEDAMKNTKVRNAILRGDKIPEITLPSEDDETKAPVGRPAMPANEKIKPIPAVIPPSVMSPREKQQEKEKLPKPKGEEAPPLM